MLPLDLVVLVLATLSAVSAQLTITTTDLLGDTIIEVQTTDAFGDPITTALETIAAVASTALSSSTTTPLSIATTSSTSALTAATTAPPDQQVGPVGQPQSAGGDPHGPTPYTFQTTDAAGDTIIVTTTFIPSFITPAAPNPIPTTGTILDYSAWLSLIGTATSVPGVGAATSDAAPGLARGVWGAAALAVGVLAGALAVRA